MVAAAVSCKSNQVRSTPACQARVYGFAGCTSGQESCTVPVLAYGCLHTQVSLNTGHPVKDAEQGHRLQSGTQIVSLRECVSKVSFPPYADADRQLLVDKVAMHPLDAEEQSSLMSVGSSQCCACGSLRLSGTSDDWKDGTNGWCLTQLDNLGSTSKPACLPSAISGSLTVCLRVARAQPAQPRGKNKIEVEADEDQTRPRAPFFSFMSLSVHHRVCFGKDQLRTLASLLCSRPWVIESGHSLSRTLLPAVWA
ncbi:hypothetical protein BDP81DRAFT_432211 [Colletotrichum phormii]|uniref:Uncharacterized protein n=1 Tax=Colletotrichum phormii TaxID=359342 RepID=A0AAI9ZQE1_9PEZI|nr:uncharacterized protein BDP81DRAFT_432211 [Colletotrichum phormii]KAK1634904.1 hypothetical protein BDP81DRAFT_432211 [Colletotrichum phormii]